MRELRFNVFKVEHKRTSLVYKGVKYVPYIGSIPKGRQSYSTTRGGYKWRRDIHHWVDIHTMREIWKHRVKGVESGLGVYRN